MFSTVDKGKDKSGRVRKRWQIIDRTMTLHLLYVVFFLCGVEGRSEGGKGKELRGRRRVE